MGKLLDQIRRQVGAAVADLPTLPVLTPPTLSVAVTVTPGVTGSPSADQVLQSLNSIPVLTGNVAVIGQNGGPFKIVIGNGLSGEFAAPLATTVAGGATATTSVDAFAQVSNNEVQKLTFGAKTGTNRVPAAFDLAPCEDGHAPYPLLG